MKFIKVKRENDYGELIDIAYSKSGKFVIYPFIQIRYFVMIVSTTLS